MSNEANSGATDPWSRPTQTFPVLTPEQSERVAAYGRSQSFDDETELFRRGDRDSDFFLVLVGSAVVLADDRSGSIKRVASGVGEGSVVVHDLRRFLHPVA